MFRQWFQHAFGTTSAKTRPGHRRPLRLECLEARDVPATFLVTNTDDTGSGSLRNALLASEASPGPDAIHFRINTGPATITPLSPLPTLRQPVEIDGTTQPGYAGRPLIELSGATAGGNGLTFQSTGSTLRGLLLTRFRGSAVFLLGGGQHQIAGNWIGLTPDGAAGNQTGISLSDSEGNVIGGPAAADRNLISGNVRGVRVAGGGSTDNRVEGNWIGLTADGRAGLPGEVTVTGGLYFEQGASANLARGNVIAVHGHGVVFSGAGTEDNTVESNRIGTDATGDTALGNMLHAVRIAGGASRNILADNVLGGAEREAVYIEGATTAGNRLESNHIGVGADGLTPLPNAVGIHVAIGAPDTVIADNLIGANRQQGVRLSDAYGVPSHHTVVTGNRIGVAADGVTALPNRVGVAVGNSFGNRIENNVISLNTAAGVEVVGNLATGNTLRGNQLRRNGRLPIDLGNDGLDATDPLDADAGPNGRMNAPLLTGATPGTRPTVTGLLSGRPGQTYQLDFYAQPDAGGGPLRTLGRTTVVADDTGVGRFTATLTVALAATDWVTATATDDAGNTSEVSLAQLARVRTRLAEPQLGGGIVFTANHPYITGDGLYTIPLNGVLRGDHVTVTAKLVQGNNGQPVDLPTTLTVFTPNGTLAADADGNTLTYVAAADGGTLTYQMVDWDSDDYGQVSVTAERANLKASAPARTASGGIRFGCEVTSSFAVDPRGQFIGVRLWYAKSRPEGGYVLLEQIGDDRGIKLGAGATTSYEISYDELEKVPPETTHLLTHVNPDKLIPEATRTDNAVATPIGSLLPNLTVRPPIRRRDGGIDFGVTATGSATTGKRATVELYYAKGPTLNDLLVRLTGTEGGFASATVPWKPTAGRRLAVAPPAEATHVIAVVDRDDRLPEANETDNLAAVPLPQLLPNYRPTGASFQDNGDLRFTYEVTGGRTPYEINPAVGVFWATGPGLADIISRAPFADATLGKVQRSYTVTVKAAKLLSPPAGVTHVLIVTDSRDQSDETNETEADNVLPVPFRRLTPFKGDLLVYRPTSFGLVSRVVPEREENTTGAGIRINGDDDNGNGTRDGNEVDTAYVAGPAEDDLLRLDLKMNLAISRTAGVDVVLRQTGTPVRLWSRQDKWLLVTTAAEQVIDLFASRTGTYWVEWPEATHGSARIELLLRDRDSGQEKSLDTVRLVTFRSSIISFRGDNPNNVRGSQMTTVIAQHLHDAGYDVHVFLPNEGVTRLGSNHRAEAELTSALQRGVTNFVMMGHSHGGGAVYDLANALAAMSPAAGSYNLALCVYIDAVTEGLTMFNSSPERRYPTNSAVLLNFYQRKLPISIILRGGAVSDPRARNIYVTGQPWGRNLDHHTIVTSPAVHARIFDAVATHLATR